MGQRQKLLPLGWRKIRQSGLDDAGEALPSRGEGLLPHGPPGWRVQAGPDYILMRVEPVKDAPLAAVGAYLYAHGNKFSGVPACASCHGANATGTDTLPRLAGQHAAYTESQLKQFSQRERANDNSIMHSVAVKMTALEMAAVAEYLSGK